MMARSGLVLNGAKGKGAQALRPVLLEGRQECLPYLNTCRYLTPWQCAPLREMLEPQKLAGAFCAEAVRCILLVTGKSKWIF